MRQLLSKIVFLITMSNTVLAIVVTNFSLNSIFFQGEEEEHVEEQAVGQLLLGLACTFCATTCFASVNAMVKGAISLSFSL